MTPSREDLFRASVVGARAEEQLAEIERLHDELLEQSTEAQSIARGEYVTCKQHLADFDRESDRLLAASAAHVRSLRARLTHAENPAAGHSPDTWGPEVSELRTVLRIAEGDDSTLVSKRLALRVRVSAAAGEALRHLLQVGALRYELSLRLVPDLNRIAQAGRLASVRSRQGEPDTNGANLSGALCGACLHAQSTGRPAS